MYYGVIIQHISSFVLSAFKIENEKGTGNMERYRKIFGIFAALAFLFTIFLCPSTAEAAGEPVINNVTLKTDWFNPGYPQGIENLEGLMILTDTAGADFVTAKIYDEAGNFVGQTKEEHNIGFDGLVEIWWDSKTDEGNEIGLPAGTLVPATAEGVGYQLQLEAVNSNGITKGAMIPFKATLKPTVSMLLSYDSYTVEPTSPLEPMITLNTTENATLELGIYSSDETVKYAEVTRNAATGDYYFMGWDGKATIAVPAQGVDPGEYLPASQSGVEYIIKITATNSYGTASTAKSFKLYSKPEVSDVTVYPTSSYGFVPGFPNMLKIQCKVKAPLAPTTAVYAEVYTASGEIIQNTGIYADYTGEDVTLYWDGKYDEDDEGHMQYIKPSASGTTYKLKVRVTGHAFEVLSPFVSFKAYPSLTIRSVSIPVKKIWAMSSGKYKAKIGVKLSRMSNVEVWVYDSSYSKIYAKLLMPYVKPNTTTYIYWDGKATSGNTAHLADGKLVPVGKYKIKVFAGGKTYKPSTIITVERLLPKNARK